MADVDKSSDDLAEATHCLVPAKHNIHGPTPGFLVRQTRISEIYGRGMAKDLCTSKLVIKL